MDVLEGFVDLPRMAGPTVATVGNFDGVHRGHLKIFDRVIDRALANGCPAIAVTFDPHPLKVLAPRRAPRMILTREQKIDILASRGLDSLVLIPFDRSVAAVEPEAFVGEFLLDRLRIRELYVGIDFRFGKARRGDRALLERLSERSAGTGSEFLVETVGIEQWRGERISASIIREALGRGDVRAAAEMMGRPYEAVGNVIHGAGRGRSQGAPTANLDVANEIIPRAGVYITEARLRDAVHPGLTNIGDRPTFSGAGFAVETWLPDFSGDLYGRRLRVRFLDRVRDEVRFPSPAALREQIARDLDVMREFFANRRPGPSTGD